jgi:hypothetical protein
VAANIWSLVPAVYAKNPEVEVTALHRNEDDDDAFSLLLTRVANTLMAMKMRRD